jgi:protein-tyrosine kinase
MSRIHEALKKAVKERGLQPHPGSVPEFPEVPLRAQTSVAESADILGSEGVLGRESPVGGHFGSPDLLERCVRPKWNFDPRICVFDGARGNSVGAERLRKLRTRLYEIASTRPLRRVLITSSVSGEGKTFVAANLAQSFLQQPDLRVLLIDADMRVPTLHTALGAPSSPGLSNYLRGEADECMVIQNGLDGNLCFIPAGSKVANPNDLLLTDRMKKLLDFVTPIFDWIILDSPPIVPVSDASVLSRLCDGVLLVVQAGETSHEIAEKACLEFPEKNLLGIVLNHANDIPADYGYEYK